VILVSEKKTPEPFRASGRRKKRNEDVGRRERVPWINIKHHHHVAEGDFLSQIKKKKKAEKRAVTAGSLRGQRTKESVRRGKERQPSQHQTMKGGKV